MKKLKTGLRLLLFIPAAALGGILAYVLYWIMNYIFGAMDGCGGTIAILAGFFASNYRSIKSG